MAGPSQGIPPKEDTNPRSQARRAVFEEFHRLHPEIQVVNAGGLELSGDRAESGFLMSMAGDTSPDVFYVNFRQYYSYIDQGFCRPLDDLIQEDKSVLSRINPTIEKVLRTYDGKLYAVPWFQVAMALYYRKDHFLEAGLDPNKPPRTWDEFISYGRKLSEVGVKDRTAFAFSNGIGSRSYHWVNMLWQAGGEVVKPAEGGYWKSDIQTPQAATALDFYRRLILETWTDAKGRKLGPIAAISPSYGQDIVQGKISMWFSYTNDVVLNQTDLNPALLGAAAMPAGPAGSRNEINAGMWAISSKVKDPTKLRACWEFIKFFAGQEAARVNTKRFVELGLGNLINPAYLKSFGYTEELAKVDPLFVAANEAVFQNGHPEPYGKNCQQVYAVLDSALDRAQLEPKTDSKVILDQVAKEMDEKLLGYTPKAQMDVYRTWANVILGCAVLTFTAIVAVVWRRRKPKLQDASQGGIVAGTNVSKARRFIFLCLLPAAGSILLWSYYPLSRGLVIAFQDYRVLQPPTFVGMDNFISVFRSPIFWHSLVNSFLYVTLSLAIGFFLPILLALALNEIPRGKVLFRTLFYLPAMVSPVVIAYLWRQFYDKSEKGILNMILSPGTDVLNAIGHLFHADAIPKAHDWLGNPSLAMFAVVLPGIWAGAGPGSILYLAALKNIPDERYEAADLDGASWVQKIRFIVFPGLRVLILINLVGVFIGGFKAMENVFILTGGGPLYSTHTVGLEVWTNAFMFLKFGYATAAAWIMGCILVGFTLIQIRSLVNVKFKSANL